MPAILITENDCLFFLHVVGIWYILYTIPYWYTISSSDIRNKIKSHAHAKRKFIIHLFIHIKHIFNYLSSKSGLASQRDYFATAQPNVSAWAFLSISSFYEKKECQETDDVSIAAGTVLQNVQMCRSI